MTTTHDHHPLAVEGVALTPPELACLLALAAQQRSADASRVAQLLGLTGWEEPAVRRAGLMSLDARGFVDRGTEGEGVDRALLAVAWTLVTADAWAQLGVRSGAESGMVLAFRADPLGLVVSVNAVGNYEVAAVEVPQGLGQLAARLVEELCGGEGHSAAAISTGRSDDVLVVDVRDGVWSTVRSSSTSAPDGAALTPVDRKAALMLISDFVGA